MRCNTGCCAHSPTICHRSHGTACTSFTVRKRAVIIRDNTRFSPRPYRETWTTWIRVNPPVTDEGTSDESSENISDKITARQTCYCSKKSLYILDCYLSERRNIILDFRRSIVLCENCLLWKHSKNRNTHTCKIHAYVKMVYEVINRISSRNWTRIIDCLKWSWALILKNFH